MTQLDQLKHAHSIKMRMVMPARCANSINNRKTHKRNHITGSSAQSAGPGSAHSEDLLNAEQEEHHPSCKWSPSSMLASFNFRPPPQKVIGMGDGGNAFDPVSLRVCK